MKLNKRNSIVISKYDVSYPWLEDEEEHDYDDPTYSNEEVIKTRDINEALEALSDVRFSRYDLETNDVELTPDPEDLDSYSDEREERVTYVRGPKRLMAQLFKALREDRGIEEKKPLTKKQRRVLELQRQRESEIQERRDSFKLVHGESWLTRESRAQLTVIEGEAV